MKRSEVRGQRSEVVRAAGSGSRVLFFVSLAGLTLGVTSVARAQKWINPNFDAHRLDYRDLGYPDVNAIEADNSPITALVTAESGMVYGATSGKTASYLFLYDRAINKVRPLGHIEGATGVHHALAQDSDGTLLIGGGLNMLAPVTLTQDFPGGFRAIEEQLWRDIAAPYAGYEGGRLYRYDPRIGDVGTRLPGEPCPLKGLGVPVKGNTIYAIALDPAAGLLYGITYPDARFFAWDLKKNKTVAELPLLAHKVYAGPERHWRSVPRALHVAASGRVYTSGDDGRIVFYDPAEKKIVTTDMQIPGEYHEAFNYYGYPVLEAWQATPDGRLYGATSDGYLFRLETTGDSRNKSKSLENLKNSSVLVMWVRSNTNRLYGALKSAARWGMMRNSR